MSIQEPDAGAITQPATIQALLQTALLDEENVELELDEDPEIYYGFLLDPPAADGAPPSPGAYLASHERILISPVEPATGNIRLQKARKIRLRFHEGTAALQGLTSFIGLFSGQGVRAFQLAFPDKLVRYRSRRTLRAKVTEGVGLKVRIKRQGVDLFEAEVADISVRGLSFYYPEEAEPLPEGKKISLELNSADVGLIPLGGSIRYHARARLQTDLFKSRQRCGIQFEEFFNHANAKKVESLVDRVAKRHQANLERKRLLFMPSPA